MRSFVIIPAYNEERQIAEVIDAAQHADNSLIAAEHILVVDNNSTDATARIAQGMGAEVLVCEEQGKGWAMQTGAEHAIDLGARALTFLDADLRGIVSRHINALAEPVLQSEALMTIGYLGGRKTFAKKILNKWGGFSGQRTVALDIWEQLRPEDLQAWRTEGALNAVLRNSRRGDQIKRIELDGVRHIGKREKEHSIARAGRKYLRTHASAFVGLMSNSGQPDHRL